MPTLTTDHKNKPYVDTYDKGIGLGDTNNCTVVALATVLGIDYSKAKLFAEKKAGRMRGKGLYDDQIEDMLSSLKSYKVEVVKLNGKTYLDSFCKDNDIGRFYVLVSSHALCIINGVIYDHSYKGKRVLKKVYKISKIED